ncbi:MAG: BatA domain-containing protein [Planctomycetes bacterium]|nr:BatA domain-containing protein [Planctomycetota bacterium]
MTFGRPETLWLLALAIPIILVHFYKGRIRRLAVPTLVFWEQIVLEQQRSTALKRLRHYLTLLLALAALALLTIALADPTVPGLTPEAREIAIIVDTAPELDAREPDGRPRLEGARDRIRAMLSGLYRGWPVALYDAGGVVEPSTLDRERLDRALSRLPREVPVSSAEEIVALARAAQPQAYIYVFTARPLSPADGRTRVVPAGTALANRALRSPALAEGRITAQAVNESDQPAEATLVLRNRGRVLSEEPLKLGPRESRRIERLLDPKAMPGEDLDRGAFVELALVPEDAYPPDDAVHFVVPALGPPLVVVVSRSGPDPHLWSALQLMGAVSIPPEKLAETRERAGAAAVYVFDRVDPPGMFDGGVLLIDCGDMGPEAAAPKLVDWDRRSPVQQLVDWSDVILRRARILTKGAPLVWSDRGPVAAAGRAMGRAWIQFGFSFGVADGDFALKSSFPILLRNAVAWLAEEGRRAFPREGVVGQVLVNQAPLSEGATDVALTTVRGAQSQGTFVPVERGEARIVLTQPGLVRLSAGGKTEWLAARLARSPDLGHLPREEGVAFPESLPWWREVPAAMLAGAAALLVLLAEWWIDQRTSTR